MNHEPLHKMFSPSTPASTQLFSAQETPLQKSFAGAFEALVDDLAAMHQRREQADRRETADRQAQQALAERQQAEALRHRRLAAGRASRMAKSIRAFIRETPAKIRAMQKAMPTPAGGDGLRTAVEKLNATHARNAERRQEQAVRDKLADLYQAAKRGELDAASVAKLDVLRCHAVAQGLRP